MDYFDPEVIEETKVAKVTEHNVQAMIASRNPKHKLAALDYLASNCSPSTYKMLIDFARYPNPEVSQKAFQILLQVVPTVPAQPVDDKELLDLFLHRVMPWVNEQAKLSTASELVETYNLQIKNSLDALLPRLDTAILNQCVLGAMNTPNYNVQIAGCQTAIHLYLAIPDKKRLSLADLFEVLLKNHMIGVKELKKNCLNVMGAVYKVFGDAVSELLDRLGTQELVDSVKKRADMMEVKDIILKLPNPLKKSLAAISVVKAMTKSGSRSSITPQNLPPQLTDENYKVNFDQYLNDEGSNLLLTFDEKWVKKMQIIKLEDGIAEELQKLADLLKDARRVLYYPEVNKNSLLLLKNYLIHPSKKIVSVSLIVLNRLSKCTARTLQDGFPLFYPELIEKLKSKSKQDGEIVEALIYLSSNVSLAHFLRRVQKDFSEKSSTLRINLIEIVSTLLNNKENYDPAERKKAGNVLLELKKFSETELSKDVSNAVRLLADKIPLAIDRNFTEEMIAALQEAAPKEEPIPIRRSIVPKPPMSSIITESTFPNQMTSPISRTTTSIKPAPMIPDPATRLSTMRKERKEELTGSANKSVDKYLSTSEWMTGESRLSISKNTNRPSIQKLPGLADITYETEIDDDLELLAKLHLEKKDPTHKAKLADTLKILIQKLITAEQFDALAAQLARVKDETEASLIVQVLLTGNERTRHFPTATVRTFLPNLMLQPKIFAEESRPARRTSLRGDISEQIRSSYRPEKPKSGASATDLIDKLLVTFGPVFFFEHFEHTMFDRDLFSSADVDPLFSLFLSLLVKVPSDYHPVMVVLSLLRGFLYFAHHTLNTRLGELAFVMLHVYGKNNFKIFKKEFEVCGVVEKVLDLAKWPLLIGLGELQGYAALPFKDKILNDAVELTNTVRSFLGTVSEKPDQHILKGLLDVCTRNYLYEIQERESTKLIEYLTAKMEDGNSQIQRAALQVFMLHSMSAKTTFKYPKEFYKAIGSLVKHNLPDLRSLALRSIRFLAKSDLKFLKLLVHIIPDISEDVRIEAIKSVIHIIDKEPKGIKALDLNVAFSALVACVAAKREDLRKEGDRFFAILLTLYERRDFDQLMGKCKPNLKKLVLDSIARIAKDGKFQNSDEDYFPILNVTQIPKDVAKCRSLKELELFANEYFAPELKQLLYDFNSGKVIQGINVLRQAISGHPHASEEAFLLLAKVLNLLLQAEGSASDGALVMAEALYSLMLIRQNSRKLVFKQERWAVFEYLRACHIARLPKDILMRTAKQAVSIMKNHGQLKEFYELVQASDANIYKKYLAPIRPLTGDQDASGEEFFESSSHRGLPMLVEDEFDQSIIAGETPIIEGPSMQESPHTFKIEKMADIMHASTGEQPMTPDSVETFENAVTVLEKGSSHLISDALVFLMTGASDLSTKQCEELLPLLAALTEPGRVNEKYLTTILQLILQILQAQETQVFSSRIILKLLDTLLSRKASFNAKDMKKVSSIEDFLISSYAWEGICLGFIEEELTKDKPEAQFAFWDKLCRYGAETKPAFSPQFVETMRAFATNGYNSAPLNQVLGILVNRKLI